MPTVPKPTGMPMLGDGFDTDGLTAVAWHQLSAFAGEPLTRNRAAALLAMWRYFAELSEDQLKAVLSRFPESITPVPPQVVGHRIGGRHGGVR